ncbi:DNA-processing protein DprA [Corynebacterium liangguodongii]|uniref:DNA processing protein DprA n=1 Tax=Corynebacterium liangguodongii TaxID=2079535 RepID=A0A2S0WES3_9CORY|nr:DNA-processing protein DprA [Corynebacterium liangguodongii]AWB84250.1 DNA processing protein DprA [Corynebacterium liangguodongii]PWC00259.1 DNA-processing protein DprA [Corynebacterium liangguodongii]
MSSLESWAYLSRVIEGPSWHLQALLRAGRDADEIAAGVRSRASWLAGLAGETEARYSWDATGRDLEIAQAAGYRLLTPESGGWPAEAIEESFAVGAAAAHANHHARKADGAPPHALWVKGREDLGGMFARSVGVVGTRASTRYGANATADLVTGLAGRGYTIVSGGAVGIDAAAHEAALAAGAATVIVAACGPGVIYPKRHAELFDQVSTVITEYPPGVSPDRHRFLTRNRLVAALTAGTLVVEAAFRSGALNTLAWAHYYNRPVMAVPGPILGPGSLGTNLAIQERRAEMVLNSEQVHALLSRVGEVDPAAQMELDFAASDVQKLSRNELRVFDAVPLGAGGAAAEDIAARAGLGVGLTVHILVDLAGRGMVTREGVVWRR